MQLLPGDLVLVQGKLLLYVAEYSEEYFVPEGYVAVTHNGYPKIFPMRVIKFIRRCG